jgi:hypothetical protein
MLFRLIALVSLLLAGCAESDGTVPTPAPTASPATSATPDQVGKEETIRGRVLFKLTCPPPTTGAAPTCTATAYLTDPAKRELDGDAIQLLRGQSGIGCQAHTTANLTCAGLKHDAVYTVTGTRVSAKALQVKHLGEG